MRTYPGTAHSGAFRPAQAAAKAEPCVSDGHAANVHLWMSVLLMRVRSAALCVTRTWNPVPMPDMCGSTVPALRAFYHH